MSDKTKKRQFAAILILCAIIVILGFSLFKSIQVINRLKESLPYLYSGEKIEYFDLTRIQENPTDIDALDNTKPSILFIFSRPCSTCDRNLLPWQKIAKHLSGKVNIYGIILNDMSGAYNFSKKAKLNFPVFVPKNIKKFIEAFRLRNNSSQTIICINNRVASLYMGELEGKDAIKILEFAKQLLMDPGKRVED